MHIRSLRRLALSAVAAVTLAIGVAAPAGAQPPALQINGVAVHQVSDAGSAVRTIQVGEAFYGDIVGNWFRDQYRRTEGQWVLNGVSQLGARRAWDLHPNLNVPLIGPAGVNPAVCPFQAQTGEDRNQGDAYICSYPNYANGTPPQWAGVTEYAVYSNGHFARARIAIDHQDSGAMTGNSTCAMTLWDQALSAPHTAYPNCANFAQGVINHEMGHLMGLDHPQQLGGVNFSPMGVSYYYHNTAGDVNCQGSVCLNPKQGDNDTLTATSSHADATVTGGASASQTAQAKTLNGMPFDPTPASRNVGARMRGRDLAEAEADGRWHRMSDDERGASRMYVKHFSSGLFLVREEILPPAEIIPGLDKATTVTPPDALDG